MIAATALAAPVPSAIATRISSSITLDGKLDEPAWREAPKFLDFESLDIFSTAV